MNLYGRFYPTEEELRKQREFERRHSADPWADFLSDLCVCSRHDEGMPFQRNPACRWRGHVHANNNPRPSDETLRKLGLL